MSDRLSLSVVVPVYNEHEVLEEFHARVTKVLDCMDLASEVVYVNDGSRDDTLEILKRLRERDPRVTVIDLSRNFGKEAALTAGIDNAKGDAAIIIDADLQDPPELIPQFVEVWQREKANVVYGRRTVRDGETWFKKATASAFYSLMQHFGRVAIPRDTGDFRLMDRRSIEALKTLPETHRFMKGLFTWIGFKQVALPYRRDPRFAGESKFNYWRLWNFALEGITSYTVAPLKLASYLGFAIAFFALIFGLVIIFKTLFFGDVVQGYPSLMVVVLFLGGLQLMFIGIIGEYLGRVFNETKNRPLYFVNEMIASETIRSEPAEPK